MKELDALYCWLLRVGFTSLREAVAVGDLEWAKTEIEMLHNLPSLVGETNFSRHKYYWEKERVAYLEWVSQPGRDEAKKRMLTYYEPFWRQMEPLVEKMNPPKNH